MGNGNKIQEIFSGFSFDYLKLFSTFSKSIGHNKLILAFAAVVLLGFGGFLMDLTKTVHAVYDYGGSGRLVTEADIYTNFRQGYENFVENSQNAENQIKQGVFETSAHFLSDRFNFLVIDMLGWQLKSFLKHLSEIGRMFIWLFEYHSVYSLIYLIFVLAVLGLFGGAISRIAAAELARGDKIGALHALKFSGKRFGSFFCAPLLPLAIVFGVGVFVLLFGLLGNIPWVGEILLGVLSVIAFILGTVMTLVIIGALAGGAMMYPVISYEASDGFDAISRTFSYVYTRPWHLTFYYIIALVYGGICYLFVRFFAFMILSVVYMFLWISFRVDSAKVEGVRKLQVMWNGPDFLNLSGSSQNYAMSGTEAVGAFFINVSVSLVIALLGAFVLSYFFCSVTTIYALMRKKVDSVELSDINMNQKYLPEIKNKD